MHGSTREDRQPAAGRQRTMRSSALPPAMGQVVAHCVRCMKTADAAASKQHFHSGCAPALKGILSVLSSSYTGAAMLSSATSSRTLPMQ